MKKCALLTLALVVAASTVAVAIVHNVGGSGTGGNTIPFWANSSYYPQMRFQTMWRQAELNEIGDISNIEFQMYAGYQGNGGTFNSCKILLCHSSSSTISTNFAANYGGGTPVTVYSGNYVLARHAGGSWVSIVKPTNFTFNNTRNLLFEVSWTSFTGGGTNYMYYSSGGPGRIYANSATATTGTVQAGYWQKGRITIGYSGVTPTSLGHVKSIFK
ncbi:MAG: hypothetical protein V3W11_00695 [bacterium]